MKNITEMNKSKIFNVSSIHQKYWKEFCDVCYSRFGFEEGEKRTYEQKYETFCRCKGYLTEDKNYELSLIKTKEEDITKLRQQVELFYDLRDARDMIPSLYALVSMIDTVVDNIKSDIELVRYMCPRKPLMNYKNMHIMPPREKREDIVNDENINNLSNQLHLQILRKVDIPPYANGFKISTHTRDCARWNLTLYEAAIFDLESVLPTDKAYSKGSELQAFLYRLFMSFQDSLTEVKERLEEFPSPLNLEELRDEYKRLVIEFLKTPLGERWAKCIIHAGGLNHFAHYFMHHRKDFSEEDEHWFFYTLDKICLIDDVLHGKAEKYWLEVKYPECWLNNRKDVQITIPSPDQPLSKISNKHPETMSIVDAIQQQTAAIDRQTETIREVASEPTHYHAEGSNYYDMSKQLNIESSEKAKVNIGKLLE